MTIYINGFKASKLDMKTLTERIRSGLESIKDVHQTKSGNIAIITV